MHFNWTNNSWILSASNLIYLIGAVQHSFCKFFLVFYQEQIVIDVHCRGSLKNKLIKFSPKMQFVSVLNGFCYKLAVNFTATHLFVCYFETSLRIYSHSSLFLWQNIGKWSLINEIYCPLWYSKQLLLISFLPLGHVHLTSLSVCYSLRCLHIRR